MLCACTPISAKRRIPLWCEMLGLVPLDCHFTQENFLIVHGQVRVSSLVLSTKRSLRVGRYRLAQKLLGHFAL